MNKKNIVFFALSLLFALPLGAHSIKINTDWEFQRLKKEQKQIEIKNQGSDWSSQFNIQHVEAQNQALAVHPDTLKQEFNQLSMGNWEKINLPHTPFVEPLVVLHQWQGICYYRKILNVSKKEIDKQLWLEFEGAMHLADVWVNGQHLIQHSGGYTPFVVDVTGMLHADRGNEILVRLDNRNNPLIPPGKSLETLDFCYYGGLYRDVNLIVKHPVHITHPIMANEVAGGGIFVTYPYVSKQEAEIKVKTQVSNKVGTQRHLTIRHTLYEWSKKKGRGKKVALVESPLVLAAGTTQHHTQQFTVNNPKLWYPDSPALYVLRTEVMDGRKVTDCEDTRIGIRRIEMTREKGFVINDKPLKLEGSNRHQEYPYVGNAISDQAQYRDMYQIRDNGFNTVRLGHYPQDPSVLEACDELGLLVIEPIPGWQFFNKAQGFVDHTYKDIRDLIRRDRNHPSVIMWETTLNESWPPKSWKDQAVRIAHEEFPGDQCYTSGDTYGYDGFDVCYNDWREGYNRPNTTSKPGFIREYYDYEFGGHYSTTRVTRGDGDYALMQNAWNAQWSHNRYRAYYPWTIGGAVWSMYDYNRGCCDNICYSGLADLFRLPKFGLLYFRTQMKEGTFTPAGPMTYEVFINSHWLEGSSDTLQVYGNVDEVKLQLNGRVIARQYPDDKPSTSEYVSRPDGGNAENIDFPPFTFFNVNWERGELKAIGYKDGKAVAEHVVRTPGAVEAMDITYFESGVSASCRDLLIVYVNLKDLQGTGCFGENNREVKLEVLQGGELRGPATIKAEAGVASFLVATTDSPMLVLKAVSGNLETMRKLKLKK
ncbi:glycoside hydrolase family 2 protein [Phocaeicola massiliensis]|uniref:glycoside hydrolase family 2 protein n=1 Tax=Phocaeicola massiliensis TaxID=204516 RepID=UPI002030BC50|nr:glycoside hydrolase family 2 TIM barrel-domain containing protein [Phocaeicola massiliensis]MCM1615333.1 glycoside hydrolase family 2 protein [Phocaeicola massiliensis]MCM1707221.1 glycoside hydrolase family 2 protein [Phocaeicola massiliensis]